MNNLSPNLKDLKVWRAYIISLFKAQCFITSAKLTSKTSGDFEAHHLYCKSTYPEKALDPTNGVLLKKTIHQDFHRLYGTQDNTPEQFEEFCRLYYNINVFPWRDASYQQNCDYVEKRFKKSPEFFSLRLDNILNERSHKLLFFENESNTYQNENTFIVVCCPKHGNSVERKTARHYLKQKTGMFCCALEARNEKTSQRAKERKENLPNTRPKGPLQRHEYVLQQIKDKNHIFVECPDSPSLILSYNYPIIVSCPRHEKTFETTSYNYLRSEKGLPCCACEMIPGRVSVSINKLFKELKTFINNKEDV